jgi:uncharacterized membrane protein
LAMTEVLILFVLAANAVAVGVFAGTHHGRPLPVIGVRVTGAAGTTLFLLACLLTISVMVVSVTRTVPINQWVVGLDPDDMPADWADRDPRQTWRTWNAVRSSLAIAALAVGLIAATTTVLS